VTDCPHKLIGADVWAVMRAVKWTEKGILPVAGGTQDQTQSFLDCMDIVTGEDAHWKKVLKIYDFGS